MIGGSNGVGGGVGGGLCIRKRCYKGGGGGGEGVGVGDGGVGDYVKNHEVTNVSVALTTMMTMAGPKYLLLSDLVHTPKGGEGGQVPVPFPPHTMPFN